jgi:hypothetical protein
MPRWPDLLNRLLHNFRRQAIHDLSPADSNWQDEPHAPSADFLVVPHGANQLFARRRLRQRDRQAERPQQFADTLHFIRPQPMGLHCAAHRRHQSDGHRLAVWNFHDRSGHCLDGVGEGMSEIEQRAPARFPFVLLHDRRLDRSASMNQSRERIPIHREEC